MTCVHNWEVTNRCPFTGVKYNFCTECEDMVPILEEEGANP